MEFSNFTKTNYNLFKDTYKLTDDNKIIQFLKKERHNIKQFIIDNKDLVIKYEKIKCNDTKIIELVNSPWVYKDGVIDELDNLNDDYKISWKANNFICIKTTREQYEIIKNRIKLLIFIIEYQKKINNCKKTKLHMYLVLTNLKKELPEKNIIGVKNVNTGYTDLISNEIFIWRLEEFEKVVIHEIIHYLDMDCRDHNVITNVQMSSHSSYFEAITDFYAILYHIIYISILTKKSIKKILEAELGFIKNQAMLMNFHFNLGNWTIRPDKLIEQNSPVFPYYILKYLLFKYFFDNEVKMDDIQEIINNALLIGIKQCDYINSNSCRMTLFQLK